MRNVPLQTARVLGTATRCQCRCAWGLDTHPSWHTHLIPLLNTPLWTYPPPLRYPSLLEHDDKHLVKHYLPAISVTSGRNKLGTIFLQQNAIPHREPDSNCTVSPPNGTATVDTWNVSCTGFKDDRGVLWYKLQCKSELSRINLMVCLHWKTETDKNDLYKILWRYSYFTETETKINFHWVHFFILSVSVSVLVSVTGSVNEP